MDLSVIIVSWNTAEITVDCIRSVYLETSNIQFEIIVVDNNSSDNSVELIEKEFPDVIIIRNSENKGFGVANNQGAAIAKGTYLLLLNSDTVILDSAIEKTVAFANNQSEAGIIGCRVLNPDKSLQATCFMFPSLINRLLSILGLPKLFPRNKFFGRERMTWWARTDTREVEVVSGCYMLIKCEIWKEVGGFDERFFMYSEEVDLCYRYNRAGWKNIFMHTAEIIHLYGESAKKMGTARAINRTQSLAMYMNKHWPKWKYIIGVLSIGMFSITRLFFASIRYLLSFNQTCKESVSYYWQCFKTVVELKK